MELSQAIRLACEGRISQEALAATLNVAQSTISRWVRGVSSPSIEQVAALERAAGRPPGFVYREAGLVVEWSVVDAINADPLLDEAGRAALLGAYRGLTVERQSTNNGTGRRQQHRAQ
jgi:transcriptional regulator with XRE-family HTH domain